VDASATNHSSENGLLREIAMDKDMASRMLNAVVALESKIGELDMLVSRIDDEKERDEYVCALGNVIGILSEKFVRQIVHQYPELDPDR
jgi:hypothetical protein